MNGFRGKTVKRMRQEALDHADAVDEIRQVAMEQAAEEIAKRKLVQSWISECILGDVALGRSGKNFVVPPEEAVSQHALRALKDRGIVCYSGAGNYFQADLSGPLPRVIQRRPLAQRFVIVTPKGE